MNDERGTMNQRSLPFIVPRSSFIVLLEQMMRQPHLLMCPPNYYGIEYEINPWMSRSRGSDPERARQQWTKLYETLQGLGVRVELLQPQPGLQSPLRYT